MKVVIICVGIIFAVFVIVRWAFDVRPENCDDHGEPLPDPKPFKRRSF